MNHLRRIICTMLTVAMVCCAGFSAFAATDTAAKDTKNHGLGEIDIGDVPMTSFSDLGINSASTLQNGRHRNVTYPASYSSVEMGYITSVKNQGNYGTCWAHATAAATEASIIKNLGYSLDTNISEFHLAYYHYNYAFDDLGMLEGDSSLIGSSYARYGFLDVGGSPFTTPFTLARWTGSVDEVENPTYAYSNARLSFRPEDWSDAYALSNIHLENMYWVSPEDKDDMKYMIMTYGAGTFSYYHDDNYYNDATAAYCIKYKNSTNHQVTVVGWDDNYSKDNFTFWCRPKNNGAWLVKNSWDTSWGDNGYFWVSYEDSSILSSWSQFYSYGTADNFDKNYQHDGSSTFLTEDIDTDATIANAFIADSNEELKAVSFWTAQNDVSYSIQVYTDLADNSNPESGTPALEEELSGKETYCGYHTIRLDKAVSLSEGERFSVVITLSANSEDELSLMIDKSDDWSWVKFTNETDAGQSFYKDNDSVWTDKSNDQINYRIKAFTDVVDEALVSEEPADDSSDETIDVNDINVDDENDTELTDDEVLDTDDLGDVFDDEFHGADYALRNVVLGRKLGDVSGDGEVTVSDVVIMQKKLANLIDLSTNQALISDIDGDMKLTVSDIVACQRYIANL